MSDVSASALRHAAVLVEMRRYQDALPLLHQAIASDPSSVRPRCLLAQCLLGVGDSAGALKAATRAIAAAPENEWGHRLRAIALVRLGRNQEAADAARQAIALAPSLASPYLAMSQAELGLRHFTPAEAAALRARELAPENPDVHNQLGLVALKRARAPEAEQHFRTALSHDPQHSEAMNNLGVALLRQGHRPQAVHYFGEASKLNPQMSVARRNAVGAAKVGVPIFAVVFLVANAASAASSGLVPAICVAAAIGIIALIHTKRTSAIRANRPAGPEDPVASKKIMRELRRDPLARQIRNPRFEMVITLWLCLLAACMVILGVSALVGGDVTGLLGLLVAAAVLGGLRALRRRWGRRTT